jgi:hypothetical protein
MTYTPLRLNATLPHYHQNLQRSQQSSSFQKQHDLMNSSPHIGLAQVDGQVGLGRNLIRVVDTSEALDLAAPCLGIDAPLICCFTVLKRLESSKGAIGAAMTAAPALVSSLATKAIRAMFLSRSAREKPSSELSSWRTVSPRRRETERPPCWLSVTLRARAMASLPEF